MGLMDFLKKKEDTSRDSFGLDSSTDNNAFSTPLSNNPMQGNDYRNEYGGPSTISGMNGGTFGQPQQYSQQDSQIQKDLQMISLKLDSIKSELDAMNQRMKNIENIAEKEQQQSKTKKWY